MRLSAALAVIVFSASIAPAAQAAAITFYDLTNSVTYSVDQTNAPRNVATIPPIGPFAFCAASDVSCLSVGSQLQNLAIPVSVTLNTTPEQVLALPLFTQVTLYILQQDGTLCDKLSINWNVIFNSYDLVFESDIGASVPPGVPTVYDTGGVQLGMTVNWNDQTQDEVLFQCSSECQASIPEPGSWGLMLTGVLGLAGFGLQRRTKAV